MPKLRFAPLAVIGLSAAIAFAQETAPDASTPAEPNAAAPRVETVAPSEATPAPRAPIRRKRKPVVKATPVPVATPAPKKPGFWERVFGKKKPKPTPAPATPTPKPVVKKITPKRVTPAKPQIAGTRPDTGKPDVDGVDPVKPVETKPPPLKTDERSKPPTMQSGRPKKGGDNVQNFPPSPDTTEADALEKQKYDQARAKAVADPKIQELRGKADLAPSENESRKALRDYNKAMFKRMKEIDPSIKDRVDRMEAAVMSRLGE